MTTPIETTLVNGKIYNVTLLKSLIGHMHAEPVALEELQECVGVGHYYWIDRKGGKLGPHQILQDWEAAQKNKEWADHVESISRANLSDPIWISKNGFVFDSMHRLTRAFLEGKKTIMAIRFEEIPKAAEVT